MEGETGKKDEEVGSPVWEIFGGCVTLVEKNRGTCGKIIIDFIAFQFPQERVDLVGHGTGKRHYYRTFKISAAKGARGDLA